MTEQLEYIKQSENLQKETFPWFCFLEEINNRSQDFAAEDELAVDSGENPLSRGPRPSERAMYLLNSTGGMENSYLRGYQLDNAILAAHTHMLKQEIQRMEYLALSHEYAGKFLKDHKAWDLVEKESVTDDESQYTHSTQPTLDSR